jgi:hypothetical protein
MAAKVNWLAVKSFFLAGHTHAECALRFGCTKRRVEQVASAEKWSAQRANVAEVAQEQLNALSVEDTKDALESHRDFAARWMKLATDAEEDLKVMPAGRSRIEARRSAMETAERALKLHREVLGFKIGQSSDDEEVTDAGITIEQIRVEPIKVPVNDEGRAVG